jgi:two-component system, NtrC family, nitrogen regulation response regulator NtrX
VASDILIVDDEADIRMLTAGILEDEGFDTREAANSAAALAEVEVRRPSLVLLDIWLQGSELDGLGILKAIKHNHPSLPVLMMSGHGTVETAVTAIKDGAYDFIEKPFKADRLLMLVERAVEASRLRRENEELRLRADVTPQLIGHSKLARELEQTIEKVATTNSRVMILGPAGSGKEVVARQVHERSPRKNSPFVVVNCATMAPERMEEELFGVESGHDGSSGGAVKIGTFEMAHNGTLLLDEVADMPLETQGKIVRALQEQVFTRVGGRTRVEVDVRVIATSTRDLAAKIASGGFREDLYYRLNVVPIEVPPLNARREDIVLLAEQFLARACEISGQPPRTIGDDALSALQSYEWPGNVRELRNAIERMLIMAPAEISVPISAEYLPHEVTGVVADIPQPDRNGAIMTLPLREARERFEHDYLSAQIKRFDGNISRTAEFVGMERSALHRKLKGLGVLGTDKAD